MTWHSALSGTLAQVPPGDAVEQQTCAQARSLCDAQTPLIRATVDTPDPHLVSYLAVIDGTRLLLGAHVKSGLWLPPGGHVEPGETPRDTALRECEEELGLRLPLLSDVPFFVTLQKTVGLSAHHDLSLWYALRAEPGQTFAFNRAEFRDVVWYNADDLPAPAEPHLARGIKKLRHLGWLAETTTEQSA